VKWEECNLAISNNKSGLFADPVSQRRREEKIKIFYDDG